MNEEDKKIYELVKDNTNTNRDVLKKEKEYLKNIQSKYKEIYGEKGVEFCEEEIKNGSKENEIKDENSIKENKGPKRKVKFSSIVQYSRN